MIPCGDIHHLRLTVTDVQRSREFYTGLLGFQVIVESPPPGDPAAAETFKILFGGVVMARGNQIMGLGRCPRSTAYRTAVGHVLRRPLEDPERHPASRAHRSGARGMPDRPVSR